MSQMRILPPNEADRRLRDEICALINRHLTPNTSERVLAIAAQVVGQVLALQDQRTMTPERAIAIVQANIEMGNQQVIANLLNAKGGQA